MLSFAKKGNNPIYALNCCLKGFQWLIRKELRKFLWIPLLINFCLYSSVLVFAYFYLNNIIASMIPDWLQWLEWVIIPLFFLCFFIIMFFSFTVLANLIAAPFYGKLAEKTLFLLAKEAHKDEDEFIPPEVEEVPFTTMLLGEIKRLTYLLKWMIPLIILSFIPVVNLIAPIIWGIFGAWGMALEFLAYPLENQGLAFPEQKQLIRSVRFGSLSLGGITMAGLTIPVFNLLASPAAVIAATVYVYGISEQEPVETQSIPETNVLE